LDGLHFLSVRGELGSLGANFSLQCHNQRLHETETVRRASIMSDVSYTFSLCSSASNCCRCSCRLVSEDIV
jgi:hypothetical protein